jgi:GDPmannose 4,6-dehydratase
MHRQGYEVFGGFRRGAQNSWRMRELSLNHSLNFVNYDATDTSTIDYLISTHKFNYVYHFAGSSFTVDSLNFPQNTLLTNVNGSVSLLEAIRKYSPSTQVFLAGSSEIYRRSPSDSPITANEEFEKGPSNPYGVSHLALTSLAEIYRTQHNLKITLGIFFNHESRFRSLQFVTRKISHGMAEIRIVNADPLRLGNFSAVRDWGCASEFMSAVQQLTEMKVSSNVVVATGTQSTVRNLIEVSAITAGFNPIFSFEGASEKCFDKSSGRLLAVSDARFFRTGDLAPLIGDASLLESVIGWKPARSITNVMEEMTIQDLKRVEKE